MFSFLCRKPFSGWGEDRPELVDEFGRDTDGGDRSARLTAGVSNLSRRQDAVPLFSRHQLFRYTYEPTPLHRPVVVTT
ncbi:hypothetical protein ABZ214_40100 [Streptomyces iakyrus]|uniref:hypothetical protein n=1 Tax=Streptomyces iakyrus TaxID=68219 RepID=UPI0033A8CB3E